MSNERLIPEKIIIEKIQYENPWWTKSEVQFEYTSKNRRLYFDLFYPFVIERQVNRALVLMGPRRVGKTVMMYHTLDKLLSENIPPKNLFFISVDDPVYINKSLSEMLELYKKSVLKESIEECYIFFDEIQYLANWEVELKVLVDSYPKTKFIVSGSAAAALNLQSKESGAGRFTDFLLPPLTFQEFLHLKGSNDLIEPAKINYANATIDFVQTADINALNQEFMNYINFGGYPEVVFSHSIQSNMNRYVKNDIIDKVLLRDLPSLYGIRDVQELNKFFTYLAYNTGKEFSYENMSSDSGVSKETIKKYLEYLSSAFLIKVLYKVDQNAKKYKRVSKFKVYLTNTSLRTALFSPITDGDNEMGAMIETAIIAQWMHRENLDLYYASWQNGRNHGEVDLISLNKKDFNPKWATEIKWSNRYVDKPNELKSLSHFCKENQLNSALITTRNRSDYKEFSDLFYTYVPAALYAYDIGRITLKQKSE